MKRMVLLFAVALAAVLCLPASHVTTLAAVEPRTRVVYVTAMDGKGAPVIDLAATDFTVKEGGKEREIAKAELATAPLQVEFLIDDNSTGLFAASVAAFVNRTLGHAEIAISTVAAQTVKVMDFTTDVPKLKEGIGRVAKRPGAAEGIQMVKSVDDAAKELQQRKAARPVIIVLTVGGDEMGSVDAKIALDHLKQSGAQLYCVSAAATGGMDQQAKSGASAGMEQLSSQSAGSVELATLLGDGPKQTGGRDDHIASATGILEWLEGTADQLLHQYAISYTLPDGVKPDEKFNVMTKRKGVTLRAPTKIADK